MTNKLSEEDIFIATEAHTTEKLLKTTRHLKNYDALGQTKFDNRISRYQPQSKNWQYDLPDKYNIMEFKPKALWLRKKTEGYIELPNFFPYMWGGALFNGLLCCALSFMFFYGTFMIIEVATFDIFDLLFLLSLNFVAVGFLFTFGYFQLKLYFFQPREIPVRLNRNTQKVYVYQYKRKYNPYAKWVSTVKVYDWKDVFGVITQIHGIAATHNLMCVVCKPGTTEVIDEFELSGMANNKTQHSETWNFCCRFMMGLDVPDEPVYQGNPSTSASAAEIEKLIKWPADIDVESRA